MVIQEFKISLNEPNAIYHSGQAIAGTVVLTLSSTKKVQGIRLSVKGKANTSWTEYVQVNDPNDKNGRTITKTVYYSGHQNCLRAKFYLFGSQSGQRIELPPGTYTYPFKYVLPPNLPSSFVSEYGSIRYTVKATFDRPWKFDEKRKEVFKVVSHVDLNQLQNASNPVDIEKNKTFGWLCWASSPLSVHISLPVRGYVPGQTIPIKVNVQNQSGVEVNKIILILQKVVIHNATTNEVNIGTRSGTDYKILKSTVAQVSKGPIGGNETTSYEQSLNVPTVPPSGLKNCRIIDVSYRLKFTALVSGAFRRNLKGRIDVLIGTVPLSNYQMSQPPAQRMDYPINSEEASQGMYPSMPTPSAPEEPSNRNHPSSNLYDLAPPTYEESVYGIKSLRDRDESDQKT